jgi:hypothetical protein
MSPRALRELIDANPHLLWARELCAKDGQFVATELDGSEHLVHFRTVGVQTIANEMRVSVPEAAVAMGLYAVMEQRGTVVEGMAIAEGLSA